MTQYAETLVRKSELSKQTWGKVALSQDLQRAVLNHELRSSNWVNPPQVLTVPTPVYGDPFSCDCPAIAELEIFDYEMIPNDQAYYEFMKFTNPNCTL